MITVPSFSQKVVAILGLGKTGLSSAQALSKGGAKILCWDDSLQVRQEAGLAHLPLHDLQLVNWNLIDTLILSPGIPYQGSNVHPVVLQALRASVPVICDIELLYRTCPQANYICVTGSNGKSTSTALIEYILRKAGISTQIGGNIGIPALTLHPLAKGETYVLELSSYQLELVSSFSATIAVFLNISKDHLERHGSLEEYIRAKRRIFLSKQKQIVVIGVDDLWSRSIYESLLKSPNHKVIPVSTKRLLDQGLSYRDGKLHDSYCEKDNKYFDLPNIPGIDHNGQNLASAYAVCRLHGLTREHIYSAMNSFIWLPHRMEILGTCKGIIFINDSKATNASATANALANLSGNIYWIAGGRPKQGGLEGLTAFYHKIRHVFLIGEATDLFSSQLTGFVSYTKCENLENATRSAFEQALGELLKNQVVLLSPACSSLDQFINFEFRGTLFRNIFTQLCYQNK